MFPCSASQIQSLIYSFFIEWNNLSGFILQKKTAQTFNSGSKIDGSHIFHYLFMFDNSLSPPILQHPLNDPVIFQTKLNAHSLLF